ncbi:MAG: methylated-DNA--[protein]-cysteine S-methyltransferase [Actinocatenispora sp.]
MTKTPTSTVSAGTLPTPVGPFSVLTDADGAVLASGWTGSPADLVPLVHPTLRPTDPLRHIDLGTVGDAVRGYLAGDLAALDRVPVRQASGPFLTHAWDVLRGIAPGAPVTYTRYAELSGRPAAVRAAANACARNAAALFVPCHRVLRTDGSLGGFRWGLAVKRWLLDHEAGARS